MEGHSGPVVYYVPRDSRWLFPVVDCAAGRGLVCGARRASFAAQSIVSLARLLGGAMDRFFSLAGTKLPSYVLPAYPALALMSAAFVDRWLKQPACVPRWLMHTAWGSLAVVGIGILDRASACGSAIPAGRGADRSGRFDSPYRRSCGHRSANSQAHRTVLWRHCSATAVLFSVALFAGAAVREAVIRIAPQWSKSPEARAAACSSPPSRIQNPAWFITPPIKSSRFSNAADVERFFEQSTGGYLITNSDGWDDLQTHLPPDVAVVARQPRFLKRGEVLLIGRGGKENRTAAVPAPPRL